MAYYQGRQSNYGNRSYGGGYTASKQETTKPPFNLEQYIDDFIDIYQIFKSKLDAAGLDIPADNIARWVTSAKIAMDK